MNEMAKGALTMFLGILIIFIVFKVQESHSYQKYIEIDDCIYLETYLERGYSTSKDRTLVGCDSLTIEKYTPKLNLEF